MTLDSFIGKILVVETATGSFAARLKNIHRGGTATFEDKRGWRWQVDTSEIIRYRPVLPRRAR